MVPEYVPAGRLAGSTEIGAGAQQPVAVPEEAPSTIQFFPAGLARTVEVKVKGTCWPEVAMFRFCVNTLLVPPLWTLNTSDEGFTLMEGAAVTVRVTPTVIGVLAVPLAGVIVMEPWYVPAARPASTKGIGLPELETLNGCDTAAPPNCAENVSDVLSTLRV